MVIGGFGQRLLAAQGLIDPPSRQAFANGGRPERIKAVRQVPEHATAAQPAALEGHPVDTEVSVPTPCLIKADGLFIGFLTSAAQSPVS